MREAHPRKLQYFRNATGRTPFKEWFEGIPDQKTQDRVQRRLDRVELGNFGDCRPVGGGVSELRLDFGPGYRIYFCELDNTIILLLSGGDKSSQRRDILLAKTYWQEYREMH